MQVKGVVKGINVKATKKPDVYQIGLLVNSEHGESWFNTITKFPDNYQKGNTVMFLTDEESEYKGAIVLGSLKKVVNKPAGLTTQRSTNTLEVRMSQLESRLESLEIASQTKTTIASSETKNATPKTPAGIKNSNLFRQTTSNKTTQTGNDYDIEL